MRYPLTAAPPSLAGALQARSMRVLPPAVAVRPVGASGTVSVVAEAVLEASELPAALTADTR